jgi:DNA-binding NtrC family response regulator
MSLPGEQPVVTPIKVLIVDDDKRLRKLCAGFVKRIGHEAVGVESAEGALAQVQKQHFDLLVTDFKMPGMTGDELIVRMQELRPDIIPIIMTAYPSLELAIDAVRKGAYGFLTKPSNSKAFKRRSKGRSNVELRRNVVFRTRSSTT